MSERDPFTLIQGTLNAETIYLRPVAFDSSDYDKNFKKPNGDIIKPTMAQTTCPKCSCVIEQSIPINFDFNKSLKVSCSRCNPQKSFVNIFPFSDPIDSLKLNIIHINPEAVVNLQVVPLSKPVVKSEQKEPEVLDKLFRPSKPMGLGAFINAKKEWNKLKRQIDDNFGGPKDVFDVFGRFSEPQTPNSDINL